MSKQSDGGGDIEHSSHRLSFSSLFSQTSTTATLQRNGRISASSSANGSEADKSHELIATLPISSGVSMPPYTSNGLLNSPNMTRDTLQVRNHHSSPASPNLIHTEQQHLHGAARSRRISGGGSGSSSHTGKENSSSVSESRTPDIKRKTIGVIGICALDTKARSKPSRNILNRLIAKQEFEVKIFGDKIILDEDVENWPVCDFLISFYSDGFPLDKAIRYARLRKPFCVNDLPMQEVLLDRRLCLKVLDSLEVPTPKRLEITRDGGFQLSSSEIALALFERTGVILEGPPDGTGGGTPSPTTVQYSDENETLIVDGRSLKKPFVEKPVDSGDHNITIYYSRDSGGGGRRLFRKINNKSSEKDDSICVPRCIAEPGCSYIYEEFLFVESAEDVKAYTVGSDYCHAETRKSPTADGLVKRNNHGNEIRYVTSLTEEEQRIAATIAEGFGQRICGFDLLRSGKKSFAIDINGWSFVKDNNDYYDNCATILRRMFLQTTDRYDNQTHRSARNLSCENVAKPQAQTRGIPGHLGSLRSILRSTSVPKTTASHYVPRYSDKCHNDPSARSGLTIENPYLKSDDALSTESHVSFHPGNGEETSNGSSSREKQPSAPPPASRSQWKLKGIVSVIRHADRTPKQKFKFTFHTKPFVDLLKGHREEVLLVGEAALASVLDAVKEAYKEGEEDPDKLHLLKTSIIKRGGWSGTKVQIKPMFSRKQTTAENDKIGGGDVSYAGGAKGLSHQQKSDVADPTTAVDNLQPDLDRTDSLAGVTMSRISAAENNLTLGKLQLIVKWGGEPTHSARYQAQDLGENFRNDLQLMNSDALKDVMVYTSSERRVTTSAQIFASAFLDESDLPADSTIVRKDLLDDSNAAKDEMDKVKKKLKSLLREGDKAPEQFAWPRDNMPEPFIVVREVVALMQYHRKLMGENFSRLTSNHSDGGSEQSSANGRSKASECSQAYPFIQGRWCCGDDAYLFKERWGKLFDEFCDAEKVDPSKISELYDTMKFDALHNRQFLEWIFTPLHPDSDLPSSPVPSPSHSRTTFDGQSELPRRKVSLKPIDKEVKVNRPPRLAFKDRSEIVPAPVIPTTDIDTHESYFSLFRSTGHSTAKTNTQLEKLRRLYSLSKTLFDYIGPQEYGITNAEKLEIGLLTSLPLLKEIVNDLENLQASENARSCFYFTKESHVYTLLNCILEGGIRTKIARNSIPELDYLSQICFELYESQNPTACNEPESFNYSIRITLSPGCHTFDPLDLQLDSKHMIGCAPRRSLTPHGDWKKVIETLRAKFNTVRLPKSFLAVNLSEKAPQAFAGSVKDRLDNEDEQLQETL